MSDLRFARLFLPPICCIAALCFANRADALLLEGPGGSLTVLESDQAKVASLYASSGSLQAGMSAPVPISEPGDQIGQVGLGEDANGDAVATWSSSRCYEGFNKYFACLSVPRGLWYAW